MQNCFLKILTETNGEQSIVYKKAEVTFLENSAKIVYKEENGLVCVEIDNKTARIERSGDYGLSLFLKEGEETVSYLTLGASKGEIGSKTDEISLSINGKEAVVCLKYTLLFGLESQNMRLCISAQLKN